MDLQQVGNIGCGVVHLGAGERPGQPVGEAVSLRQLESELAFMQRSQGRRGHPHEAGSQLRVEQVPRHGSADSVEYLQILTGGVHDHQQIGLNKIGKCCQVQLQRVQQDKATLPGDLYQGHPGEVGLLAMKLRIDRYAFLPGEGPDQIAELRLIGDQAVRRIGPPVQAGLPDSVGRPASTQAVVPPATLTASRPSALRNSAAALLRPPFAQIT